MPQRVRNLNLVRIVLLLFLVLNMQSLGSSFAAADPASISVVPVWHPALQLTSIVGDTRFADVDLYVTSSLPYWTVEFTCTIAPALLQPTTVGSFITFSPDWGIIGNDYTTIVRPYNATAGSVTFSATRLGDALPMGSNGVLATSLLATIHYQVKSQLSTFTTASSPFTCTTSFLDRNGASVMTATYVVPPALTVLSGYTVKGQVTYQGRTTMPAANVSCAGFTPVQSSTANGQFTISNIRRSGDFDCNISSTLANPVSNTLPGPYLGAATRIHLTGQSFTMLPIMLRGGDLNSSNSVNFFDLGFITSNYGATTGTSGKSGDVNGDNRTDKTDLAILSSNYNYYAPVRSDHILYGVARSVSTALDNRIWLGTLQSGAVTQFVAGTNRDFWPAVSPDGTKIAFMRLVGSNHILFVQPLPSGTAVQLTPTTGTNSGYQNFAPSWSPDGNKIAFVCSVNTDWLFNTGNVCLVDPTAKSFQVIPNASTSVFPPAWLDNHTIIFSNSGTLMRYRLGIDQSPTTFNIMFPNNSDMPIIRSGIMFYRVDGKLAYADVLGPISSFGTGLGPGLNDYLKDFLNTPITNFYNVDYYVVSPTGDGVIFTDLTGNAYYNLQANDETCISCPDQSWYGPNTQPASTHFVYNQFPNPVTIPLVGEPRFGERNTADWEP